MVCSLFYLATDRCKNLGKVFFVITINISLLLFKFRNVCRQYLQAFNPLIKKKFVCENPKQGMATKDFVCFFFFLNEDVNQIRQTNSLIDIAGNSKNEQFNSKSTNKQ